MLFKVNDSNEQSTQLKHKELTAPRKKRTHLWEPALLANHLRHVNPFACRAGPYRHRTIIGMHDGNEQSTQLKHKG